MFLQYFPTNTLLTLPHPRFPDKNRGGFFVNRGGFSVDRETTPVDLTTLVSGWYCIGTVSVCLPGFSWDDSSQGYRR